MMDLLHTLVALSISIISNSGICTPYNYSPIEKLLILEHQGPWRLAVKFMISNAVVMSLRVFPFTEIEIPGPSTTNSIMRSLGAVSKEAWY